MVLSFHIDTRIACALLVAALLPACSGEAGSEAPSVPAAPVKVASVATESVPVELRAIGRVEASSTVEIRSRVGGELVRIHFARGQAVAKGDPLFEIDSRPYRAALDQAEARLAQDRAVAENARAEVDRYASLVEKDYVTKEQYDSIIARAASTEATVRADEAAARSAELDLRYCAIEAPISGRAGDLLVHEGTLIKANADAPMVILLRSRPVLVSFSVPEQYLPQVRIQAALGPLDVRAAPPGGDGKPSQGKLSFIDNAIDVQTGTILLKAAFPNEDDTLWPGEFVDAVLTLSVDEGVPTVPSGAVQQGQEGSFVFVVKPDGTVESRAVDVVREYDSRSIIGKGLTPGETVVTEGQLRLVPGALVEIKSTP